VKEVILLVLSSFSHYIHIESAEILGIFCMNIYMKLMRVDTGSWLENSSKL